MTQARLRPGLRLFQAECGEPNTEVSIVRRSLLLAMLAALSLPLAVSACGDLQQPVASAKASRRDLLVKARSTTLGQDIAYPHNSHAEVSSAIVTIPPGAQTGWHRHDTPLVVHVLKGDVTVEYDGGVVKTYHAGDTSYWTDVYYWNTPTAKCLDGRTDVQCVPYSEWATAWSALRS